MLPCEIRASRAALHHEGSGIHQNSQFESESTAALWQPR
jgi:hypothetical protein